MGTSWLRRSRLFAFSLVDARVLKTVPPAGRPEQLR
jgi:hypothetical protein